MPGTLLGTQGSSLFARLGPGDLVLPTGVPASLGVPLALLTPLYGVSSPDFLQMSPLDVLFPARTLMDAKIHILKWNMPALGEFDIGYQLIIVHLGRKNPKRKGDKRPFQLFSWNQSPVHWCQPPVLLAEVQV